MPELPEVETIRRGLERRVRGARIGSIEVRDVRLRREVDVDGLLSIRGREIVAIERRGKYLLLRLDDDRLWLFHLGMSGRLLLVGTEEPIGAHEHVRATIEGVGRLVLRDPRRFGLCRVGREADLEELRELGPEPLDPAFDVEDLARRLRATRRDVKAALLDQRLVAGVGNIYANEILHRAGVRPTRRGHRLTRAEARRIALETPRVLAEAVERRGTSFSDYFDIDGIPGSFQERLWVFDRLAEPCRRCGEVIRRVVHGGRSSFFCRACQR